MTEFVCGHVYWPCSVNSRAWYQALLSPLLQPGNEASNIRPEGSVKTSGMMQSLQPCNCIKDPMQKNSPRPHHLIGMLKQPYHPNNCSSHFVAAFLQTHCEIVAFTRANFSFGKRSCIATVSSSMPRMGRTTIDKNYFSG